MATELPLRYRKLATKKSKCYTVVAGLWAAALITFIAPLLTKPNWSYYRYNDNQKMCGLHWEYRYAIISRQNKEDIKMMVTTAVTMKTRTMRKDRATRG